MKGRLLSRPSFIYAIASLPDTCWYHDVMTDSHSQRPAGPEKLPEVDSFRRDHCGVIILGTEAGCGKTVFATGVAAALREEGFPTRAIKPFLFSATADGGETAGNELSFMSSIARTPLNYPTFLIDKRGSIPPTNWQHFVTMCASKQHLTFVELPGSCATPVSFAESHMGTVSPDWKDSADFAIELDLPVILVARHNFELLEKTALAVTYLRNKGAGLIGVATVETKELPVSKQFKLTRADLELSLSNRMGTHFLGCIQYSPSISVARVNQGNLIKMTSQGIDMLLILRELNPPVSSGA